MKLGIMQPYFFPYIGYWQLLNYVDTYVVYDDIEYTKKGWINRNRFLSNGKATVFSIPIKKDSDHLFVKDRYVADSFYNDRRKILRKIEGSYRKAPFFNDVYPFIEEVFDFKDNNLFAYVFNSIVKVKEYLGIDTEIFISSKVNDFTGFKGADKVLNICKFLNSSHYINPIGGLGLYDKDEFVQQGINLNFLKSNAVEYPQFNNEFIANLSMIDVLMFNSPGQIKEYLSRFELV